MNGKNAVGIWSDSLAEHIAELNDLRAGNIDPDQFFRRNRWAVVKPKA